MKFYPSVHFAFIMGLYLRIERFAQEHPKEDTEGEFISFDLEDPLFSDQMDWGMTLHASVYSDDPQYPNRTVRLDLQVGEAGDDVAVQVTYRQSGKSDTVYCITIAERYSRAEERAMGERLGDAVVDFLANGIVAPQEVLQEMVLSS